MSSAVVGTPENLASLVGDGTVLVDFWAPWCAPCKVLGQSVDRIAREEPSLSVVKVDISAHPDLASAYGVVSIPTLVLLSGGQEVSRKVGAAGGYGALKDLVAPHLTPRATT